MSIRKDMHDRRLRIIIIGAFFGLVFLLMGVKAFSEQVKLVDEHTKAVVRQSIRRIRIPANRGRIFSADMAVLAENRVSYDLNFYLEDMRRRGPAATAKHAYEIYQTLAATLDRPPVLKEEHIRHHVIYRPGLPMTAFTDLGDREIAKVFELQQIHSGLEVTPSAVRFYPHGELAAQLIGYAKREDPALALDRKDYFYYQSDLVGKSGLELFCNEFPSVRGLRGEPGFQLVKVDNFGFIREVLEETQGMISGNNVVLTLDAKAQTIAEELMRYKVGSMVVLNADSGEVIAMTSQPAYDLNWFSPAISHARYDQLNKDPRKPFLNRSTRESYMPGSIIKVLAAMAFLKHGLDPEESVYCDGRSVVNGVTVRCNAYNSGGHGEVNMFTALERSCNDYFVEHAVALGLDELAAFYAAAGIGIEPGFELGGTKGILPGRDLLRRLEKREWSGHDTAMVSIGQGMVQLTPLQAALYTAAIANGGRLMTPFIVKKVVDDSGNVLREFAPSIREILPVGSDALETIRQGMYQVVHAPRGTGARAKSNLLTLYAKTGTAQVGVRPNLRNNSTLIMFTHYADRSYALAMVIENDPAGGGGACAPLAKTFFERYLTQ